MCTLNKSYLPYWTPTSISDSYLLYRTPSCYIGLVPAISDFYLLYRTPTCYIRHVPAILDSYLTRTCYIGLLLVPGCLLPAILFMSSVKSVL